MTLRCPGQLAILDWSLNAYAAGTANKTVWTSVRAETLMKQLVTNNCTSSATTGNGRDRTRLTAGALNGVTIAVQADAGGGNLVSYESARGNVLAELKRVWDLGAGGDFDLIKTGAAAWEFRFYAGQRGTDRSASVTFSTDYGTMGRPKLTINRTSERTAAIVAGQGQRAPASSAPARVPNYVAASNDVEVLVDGRNAATTAALDSLGDKKFSELRSRAKLSFTPLQTPRACSTATTRSATRSRAASAVSRLRTRSWAIQAALAPGRDEELSITLRDLMSLVDQLIDVIRPSRARQRARARRRRSRRACCRLGRRHRRDLRGRAGRDRRGGRQPRAQRRGYHQRHGRGRPPGGQPDGDQAPVWR